MSTVPFADELPTLREIEGALRFGCASDSEMVTRPLRYLSRLRARCTCAGDHPWERNPSCPNHGDK